MSGLNRKISYDKSERKYFVVDDTAVNEAVLMFTGNLLFNEKKYLQIGDFDEMFEGLEHLIRLSDFVCAPMTIYRNTGNAQVGSSGNEENEDGASEVTLDAFEAFLDTVFDSGFSLLYNDKRMREKYRIMESKGKGIILDSRKDRCVVSINGINVGFYKFSINDEYGLGEASISIQELKSEGADYIVVFSKRPSEGLAKMERDLSKCGADCIVLNNRLALRKNKWIKKEDGSRTLVIGSLAQLFGYDVDLNSAAVKVRLLKNYDGTIDVKADYVPLRSFQSFGDEQLKTILPTKLVYNGYRRDEALTACRERVESVLGTEVKMDGTGIPLRNTNGFVPHFSIRELYEMSGQDSSAYNGEYPVDEKLKAFVIRPEELINGCAAFVDESKVRRYSITEEMAREKGAAILVTNKKHENFPCLVVDDPNRFFKDLAIKVRNMYNPYTVAITGTVGKTTTTDMIKSVMKYGYDTLDIRGNFNTWHCIGFCVQKLRRRHKAYIQEVHGGNTGAASENSKLVSPDACVVTYVGAAHLSQIAGGTVQDVLREKLSITDGLKEGGTLFLNNDNEYLRNVEPSVKTIRYSSFDTNADYYAENIQDLGDRQVFQIVSKEGRYDAMIMLTGAHNVANAVCAFAVGREAGIEPYRIIAGLSRFRTEGMRQNTVKKDGYLLKLDCKSTTPDSMLNALKGLSDGQRLPGGRKIAILGDTAMLKGQSIYWHTKYGEEIAKLDIDAVITLGKRSMHTVKAAEEAGVEAYGYTDRDEFEKKIQEFIKPNDTLLFKSSMKVKASLIPTIEKLFGKIQ